MPVQIKYATAQGKKYRRQRPRAGSTRPYEGLVNPEKMLGAGLTRPYEDLVNSEKM